MMNFMCDRNFTCCNWQYADKREDIEQEADNCGHLIEVVDVDTIPHFIDIKKQKPESGQEVLLKYHKYNHICRDSAEYDKAFYHVEREEFWVDSEDENYSWVELDRIIGWLPIEELDKIEVK